MAGKKSPQMTERQGLSMAFRLAVWVIHAAGLSGTPSRGQRATAVTNAS